MIKSIPFPETRNRSSLRRGSLPWKQATEHESVRGFRAPGSRVRRERADGEREMLDSVILGGLLRAQWGGGWESKLQGSRCQARWNLWVPSGKGETGM